MDRNTTQSHARQEQGDSVVAMRIFVAIGSLGAIVAALVLGWFFIFSDTWESDNAFMIRRYSEDAIALTEAQKHDEARTALIKLQELVGDRTLIDQNLRELHDRATTMVSNTQAKLDRERVEAENLLQERQTLHRLTQRQARAKELEDAGDLDGAHSVIVEAIRELDKLRTGSLELNQRRVLLVQSQESLDARIREREFRKEQARAAEEAQLKLAAVRAQVRGGAWITRKSGSSEPLRGLDVFAVKRWVPAADTIPVYTALVRETAARLNEAARELNEARNSRYPYKPLIDACAKVVDTRRNSLDRAKAVLAQAKAADANDMVTLQDVLVRLPYSRGDGVNSAWLSLVADQVISRTHADIDGKFEITLSGGPQCLFALFETSNSRVVWCIPVDITDTSDRTIDLRNANAMEIHNKDD